MRHRLGVDKPIGAQYVDFLVNALRGDWGSSLVTGKPVVEEVRKVLPYTIDLTVTAIVLGAVIGVPLGVWSALRRNTWVDYVRADRVAARPVVSGLRLGDPAAARLRHPAALVPGDQRRVARRSRRAPAQPRAARHQSGPHHGGLHDAGDALVDARGAGRGLHPHGARQGRADARRHLAPRLPQRPDPGRHRRRPLSRHPDRQFGADRDRLQPAGAGQADRRRAQPARLHDAAGHDGHLRVRDRAREPADRPHLRLHRSAGEDGNERGSDASAWRSPCRRRGSRDWPR